jgi:hypothetical protein
MTFGVKVWQLQLLWQLSNCQSRKQRPKPREKNVQILQFLTCNSWLAILDMQFLTCNYWLAIIHLQFLTCNSWLAILDMQFLTCNSWLAIIHLQFLTCNSWLAILDLQFLTRGNRIPCGRHKMCKKTFRLMCHGKEHNVPQDGTKCAIAWHKMCHRTAQKSKVTFLKKLVDGPPMSYVHFTFSLIHMLWGIPSQWRFFIASAKRYGSTSPSAWCGLKDRKQEQEQEQEQQSNH